MRPTLLALLLCLLPAAVAAEGVTCLSPSCQMTWPAAVQEDGSPIPAGTTVAYDLYVAEQVVMPVLPHATVLNQTAYTYLGPAGQHYVWAVARVGALSSAPTPVTAFVVPAPPPPPSQVLLTVLIALTHPSANGRVLSSPAAINCSKDGGVCQALFPVGSPVHLLASPHKNSRFLRWEGACTGTSTSCVLTPQAALTVRAVFGRK